MQQSQALDILKAGRNVFLTGSAGTGKTYVLNQYIKYLKERKVPVAITASTGIAATHMNGMTIHSWSGIGIKDHLTNKDLENLGGKVYMKKKMAEAQVLIIDEISMLHKDQLEMVDQVLRYFKDPFKAFGGVQLILSGDFFQLPPIGQPEESNRDKFAFMAKAWLEAELVICYLTEQYRQSDHTLNDILNEIRTGAITNESLQLLQQSQYNTLHADWEPTQLYTHNYDVDRINKERLDSIPDKAHTYEATTKGNPTLVESLTKSVLAEERLELKAGAKVMFVRNNYEKGYMNGTLGVVKHFDTDNKTPMVQLMDDRTIVVEEERWAMEDDKGRTLAAFIQLPLRLAWAITVHKSQGMTLDAAQIDLSKTFERGQGYVALSRLKGLEGLQLTGFNKIALEVDGLAAKADIRFQELSLEAAQRYANPEELKQLATAHIKARGGITDLDEIQKEKQKRKSKKIQKEKKQSTYEITKEMVENGRTIESIAEERGLTSGTIMGHLLKISEEWPEVDLSRFRPDDSFVNRMQAMVNDQIAQNKINKAEDPTRISTKALYDALNGEFDYATIKLALIYVDIPSPT